MLKLSLILGTIAALADVAGGLVDGPGAGASAGARPATGVGPG